MSGNLISFLHILLISLGRYIMYMDHGLAQLVQQWITCYQKDSMYKMQNDGLSQNVLRKCFHSSFFPHTQGSAMVTLAHYIFYSNLLIFHEKFSKFSSISRDS